MTIRCSGSSVRSYTCRQSRIRSPSGTAVGSTRGVAPVASSTVEASTAYVVTAVRGDQHLVGVTERVLAHPGAPVHHVHAALISFAWMSPDWASASFFTRLLHRDRVHLDARQARRAGRRSSRCAGTR